MKPATILFAIMASVALASPVAMSRADTATVSEDKPIINGNEIRKAEAAADCKQCNEFFRECRISTWCFYNPWGCFTTCNMDTCRKFNQACTHCGYTEKC